MRSVSIELTNACPWKCQHCLPASGLARMNELPCDAWTSLLRALAERGLRSAYYSGGEPTTRLDLLDILASGHDLGLSQSIVTSGVGITTAMAVSLSALDIGVYVSLDGDLAEIHDRTRGVGSFDAAVAALRACQAHGVISGISCTVTAENVTRLSQIMALARQYGARRSLFSEVVRGGRARRHWHELALGTSGRRQLLEWFRREVMQGSDASASDDRCWVDGSSVYLNSQGRVYLCSELAQFAPRSRVGHILNDEGQCCDESIERWLDIVNAQQHGGLPCRYVVETQGSSVLVIDSERPCALLSRLEGVPALN